MPVSSMAVAVGTKIFLNRESQEEYDLIIFAFTLLTATDSYFLLLLSQVDLQLVFF